MSNSLATKTSALAKQVWRGWPGPEDMDGLTLAKRMIRLGIIKSLDDLLSLSVGQCLKTGISAWGANIVTTLPKITQKEIEQLRANGRAVAVYPRKKIVVVDGYKRYAIK